jgi:hypothetical protein
MTVDVIVNHRPSWQPTLFLWPLLHGSRLNYHIYYFIAQGLVAMHNYFVIIGHITTCKSFVTIIWCSVRSYMRKFGYWSHKTEQRIVTWEWDGLTAHGWKCSPSKRIRCWEAFWRQARTHRSWEGFLTARRAIKSVVCSCSSIAHFFIFSGSWAAWCWVSVLQLLNWHEQMSSMWIGYS